MFTDKTSFDTEGLKNTCMALLHGEKRKELFAVLDFFYTLCNHIPDYDAVGYLALKADHRDLYLRCAETSYAIADSPEQIKASRANLYKAYNALNYPEKALFHINIALQLDPDDVELQTQKAFNHSLMGDKVTGEKILEDLMDANPDKRNGLNYALSGKKLREGKTSEGIISFLNTFKPKNEFFDDRLGMKKWMGQPVSHGTLLYVNGEGGIGDEFINIRFFDHLKEIGIKPILYSPFADYQKSVNEIFRRHGHEVITEPYSIKTIKGFPSYDVKDVGKFKPPFESMWTDMMSLPGYLGLDETTLWRKPYLTPIRNSKNNLSSKKFKIGIKCNGNPFFAQDEYRKIPIELMLSYLPQDAEIYFFDKENTHSGVINLGNRLETWDDTLDFIDQMDCIVSSCTSLVHASGAMGKTTFVTVPIAEYYIWTCSRTDNRSVWYGDNFYVFKQKKVRDWNAPLSEMQIKVNELMLHKKDIS